MGVIMKILPVEERDHIFKTLTLRQKTFIQQHVKRGKKTVFANVMAKDKGIVIPEHATNKEIEYLLDEWVLEDYIDNGFINPETPCECGKPLRYQYIVRHKSTNETRRFGKTHFKEHTGIPSSIVAEILKGFDALDYEMDELLIKLQSDWSVNTALSYIPENFIFTKDIKEHIENDVPLLERQLKRLKNQIAAFELNNEFSRRKKTTELFETSKNHELVQEDFQDQFTFDFDKKNDQLPGEKETTINGFDLSNKVKDLVIMYLDEDVSSVRIICELLIRKHSIPNERYITNKPKIYPYVCLFLESLVIKENVRLIETKGHDDRIYELI